MVDLGRLIPAGEGAVEAQISRERLIRKIQLGEVVGAKVIGIWMVDIDSLREYVARQSADGPSAA